MADDPVFLLTVAFALITGTAAAILAVLTWEILRQSPIGRVLLVLTGVEALFMLYHVLVLVTPQGLIVRHLVHSALYTATAGMVVMLVIVQRRIRTRTRGKGEIT